MMLLLRRAPQLLWRSAFVVVAMLATIAVGTRVFTALAPSHLSEVEAVVGSLLGRNVAIGSLRVTWQKLRPIIVLHNFALLDDRRQEVLRFKRVRAGIDLIGSVLRCEANFAALSLAIERLKIVRYADGAVGLDGLDPHDNHLMRWLLAQHYVTLHATAASISDRLRPTEAPAILPGVHIVAARNGPQKQLHLIWEHAANIASSGQVSFQYRGDLPAGRWTGTSYAEVRELDLDILRRLGLSWPTISPRIKQAGGQVWLDWKDGSPTTGVGALRVSDRGSGRETAGAIGLNGRFNLSRTEADDWRLNFTDIKWRHGDRSRMLGNIGAHVGSEKVQGTGRVIDVAITQMSLRGIVDVVAAVAPPAEALAALVKAEADGELRGVRWQFETGDQVLATQRLHGVIGDLGWKSVNQIPGLANVDVEVDQVGLIGSAKLIGHGSPISYPMHKAKAIDSTRINGNIAWAWFGTDWQAEISEMDVTAGASTARLQGWLAGNVQAGLEKSPINADLALQVDRLRLIDVGRWMPEAVPAKVRQWIATAFVGGEFANVAGRVHGPLRQFPFDNSEGTSELTAEIEDATLTFAGDWPSLEAIKGRLNYSGREIRIHSSHATTARAALSHVDVSVVAMGTDASRLVVDGQAVAAVPAAVDYLMATPLLSDSEKRLSMFDTAGDAALNLGFNWSFHDRKPQVKGHLVVRDGTASELRNIRGQIDFTENQIVGNSLRLSYFDRPLVVSFMHPLSSHLPKQGKAEILARLDAGWVDEMLERYARVSLPKARLSRKSTLVRGATTLRASLHWPARPVGDALSVRVQSDLRGLAVAAPPPFGKGTAERLRLVVIGDFHNFRLHSLHVDYGRRAITDLNWGQESRTPTIAIGLGGVPSGSIPNSDLLLSGTTPKLSVTQWSNFLSGSAWPKAAAGVVDKRVNVDINVQDLELAGHSFQDVNLRASNSDRPQWQARFDGPTVTGTLRYAPELRAVSGRFGKLWLSSAGTDSIGKDVNPQLFPDIEIECQDFRYQGSGFGKMRILAHADNRGLHFSRLEFNAESMRIAGRGSWLMDSGQSQSDFDIAVDTPAVGNFLHQFGYDNDIADGKSRFRIQASWQGTPAQFDLTHLDGHLNLTIGRGRLLALENRVGRIFGLLSVNTFWRRLTLDFSDVFRRGFAFDTIAGDFSVSNGVAHTSNLVLGGPAATIAVTGTADLARQTYDQRVTVTPEIAAALPVAGVFFGPAGLGAGAAVFLAGKVFPSVPRQIDAMMSSEYSITGSWQNPQVRKR